MKLLDFMASRTPYYHQGSTFRDQRGGFYEKEGQMTQAIEVLIDNHGGILLPQELKHRLGLLPGMTMVVEEDDDEGVCLRVQTDSPELVDKQGIIVVRAESSEDLTNVTRRARDHRVSDLLNRYGR
jgi:bifunctional DNA-binding transcriptional regulator/antitoxin component of YhaV-PrlF toxin-antitoxin module